LGTNRSLFTQHRSITFTKRENFVLLCSLSLSLSLSSPNVRTSFSPKVTKVEEGTNRSPLLSLYTQGYQTRRGYQSFSFALSAPKVTKVEEGEVGTNRSLTNQTRRGYQSFSFALSSPRLLK
ncbi:Hypothetical protein BRZCDTV_307, partial [Brazilian cedratvirus IHUMI]